MNAAGLVTLNHPPQCSRVKTGPGCQVSLMPSDGIWIGGLDSKVAIPRWEAKNAFGLRIPGGAFTGRVKSSARITKGTVPSLLATGGSFPPCEYQCVAVDCEFDGGASSPQGSLSAARGGGMASRFAGKRMGDTVSIRRAHGDDWWMASSTSPGFCLSRS